MLLEIENALYVKVHECVGRSAIVHRLAEALDDSGAVVENTNIIVSFSGSSTNNPHKGAYIPTVRNRILSFKITIVQKQSQRSGHSFALPLLDLIADNVTGWVPCLKEYKFQTGFELVSERFTQITEASQYIYEQNYQIEVLIADGRMVSSICAATDCIALKDYIPDKRCLLTKDGLRVGLAIWKIRIDVDTYEEYIVIDEKNCPAQGELTYICDPVVDGRATFEFYPYTAYSVDPRTGETVLDESQKVVGTLENFVPCLKEPPIISYKVKVNLWLNSANHIGERVNPRHFSIVPNSLSIFENTPPEIAEAPSLPVLPEIIQTGLIDYHRLNNQSQLRNYENTGKRDD